MDTLVVVVVDPESNGFVEFGNISIFRSLAELELELAEPALDKAVLPGAALARAAQADLQLAAKLPLAVRKIFAALVGMEDRRRLVFAQGIQERVPSQPGAAVASQPPADDLPGFVGAPGEMESQPPNPIKRVLQVGGPQLADCGDVFGIRFRRAVKAAFGNAQDLAEAAAQTRLDGCQNFYFFWRFSSAVARPSRR